MALLSCPPTPPQAVGLPELISSTSSPKDWAGSDQDAGGCGKYRQALGVALGSQHAFFLCCLSLEEGGILPCRFNFRGQGIDNILSLPWGKKRYFVFLFCFVLRS